MESTVKERSIEIESTGLCRNLGWLLSQANHAMTTEMTARRARIIRVTEQGAAKAAEAKRIIAELQEEILDSLPADQRTALMDGLQSLVGDRLAEPVECGRAVRRRD